MSEEEKKVIKTIYHKDIAEFFKSVGLFKALMNGEIRCNICRDIITIDNFRAVARKSGELIFCCKKESCIDNFASNVRRR